MGKYIINITGRVFKHPTYNKREEVIMDVKDLILNPKSIWKSGVTFVDFKKLRKNRSQSSISQTLDGSNDYTTIENIVDIRLTGKRERGKDFDSDASYLTWLMDSMKLAEQSLHELKKEKSQLSVVVTNNKGKRFGFRIHNGLAGSEITNKSGREFYHVQDV